MPCAKKKKMNSIDELSTATITTYGPVTLQSVLNKFVSPITVAMVCHRDPVRLKSKIFELKIEKILLCFHKGSVLSFGTTLWEK